MREPLERWRHCFGISGTALNWLKSYLSGRTQYISYHSQSDVMVVKFGVPQESILGPLLFLLYTSEIFALVEEHGFRVHGYADDLQIYEHHDQRQSSNVISRFSNCVDAVKDWMARNRLRQVKRKSYGWAPRNVSRAFRLIRCLFLDPGSLHRSKFETLVSQ